MKLLREPLLHFLVIGAALFGTFYVVDGRNGRQARRSSSAPAGSPA